MPGDERDEVGSPNDGRGQAKPTVYATGALVNPNDACTCPPGTCIGVPGETDGPRVCRPCLRLDPEMGCIRNDEDEP